MKQIALRHLVVVLLVPALSGCLPSAGTECLNSFKSSLKDPDSGKVVAFDEPILTYTATNSYGGRTQGKALCKNDGRKWVRDRAAELIAEIDLASRRSEAFSKCVEQRGGQRASCDVGSQLIRDSIKHDRAVDWDALRDEAATELGYR